MMPHIVISCLTLLLLVQRFHWFAAVTDQLLRRLRAGRLCYYSHDWFRSGRPDVHPTVRPAQSQAILGIYLGVGEDAFERFVHGVERGSRTRKLVFNDNVPRVGRDDLGERFSVFEQELEHEGGSHRGVPAQVKLRQDYAAVPLPANWRLLLPHARCDVHLADWHPDYPRSRFARDVVHDPAGREIGDDHSFSVSEHDLGREREGVILAYRQAFFRHERQTIHVGVYSHPDVAVGIENELLKLTEILSNGLGGTGESAVGLHVDRGELASEQLKEDGHEDAAGATDAIQSDLESALPDSLHIEKRKGEDFFNVIARGVLVLRDHTELVPARARNFSLDDLSHVRRFCSVEKKPRRADELERVPL